MIYPLRQRSIVRGLAKGVLKQFEAERVQVVTSLWRRIKSRMLSLIGLREQAIRAKMPANVYIDGRLAGTVTVESGPNGLEMKWHKREPKA